MATDTASIREGIVRAIMLRRGCSRTEAEVIMARIGARLDGHTHEQAAALHPLPESDAA